MPDKVIIRSFPKLQQYLTRKLEQNAVNAVSVDIFDTLLARIDTPEQVQRAVCRLLAGHLNANDAAAQRYSTDQIWLARQHSERQLRDWALRQGLDYECRFSEWVVCWLETLTAQAADQLLVKWVIRTELELEKEALYVKQDVIDFMAWLSKQPVRLLAISDMYLDGEYIAELLTAKGLMGFFEQVIVSADSGLCKYSGRLYLHVAAQQNVDKTAWVHIGDNPISDRRAACEAGLQGVYVYEKNELRRREQQQLNVDMAKRGSIWKGQHFFSVLKQRLQVAAGNEGVREDQQDFYFRYGRDVLGGAFSTFTLGLQERIQRRPIDKLFFVARDGYLFQQLYQQLDQTSSATPDEYIYLSRKVITAAAVAQGLTHEQAQIAFYNPKQQGLRSVCKVYGLPEAELAPLARNHGFIDFAEPLQDWQDARLLAFLADKRVQAIIKPQGKQQRDLLEAYLEQVGFFAHQHIALVDIGWNGTVQKFLKQAFGDRVDFPVVNGYYFAFVPKMYHDFGAQNFCEGIIHDSRRDNACERIPAEFEEIFEQGARAQGATTVGYERVNGVITPLFKSAQAADRRAEMACNEKVAAIQKGVLFHWQHFRAVQRLTGYSSQALLPYVYGQLERAIVYPSREETRLLTRLVHTEDFGDDHVLDLGQQALHWRDLLKPWQVWQRLRNSAWRYALFAGVPTGMANFMLRMAYLHAVKK